MKTEQIATIVEGVKLNDQKSAAAAAKKLVESIVDLKAGQSVAVIDDPTYGQPGITGKIKGQSAKGSGFWDVELPNGTVVPMQSDLLLPV
jgi:hypothetical protein